MIISYGLLGDALCPDDLAEQTFITVPTGHEYIGVVRVCNLSSSAETFRLAHKTSSGAAAAADWDCYDTPIEVGETIDITMEMGEGEVLRVKVSTADVIAFKFTGMDRVA